MTIDALAIATQEEFDIIHDEFRAVRTEIAEMKATMATKDELKSMEDRILNAIAGIDGRFSAYAVRTNEDVSRLQGSNKDLDIRLRVVEKRG
ncbi:MAG TPA: hypothetical protein VMR99_03490 [Candidatus Paceibacterota bacterium]|nr:hypothetical protein [Candidatus Paceibacterota bacterium]